MPKRTDFVDHVVETMRLFGPVECRRMFGGWGFYHQARFFALIMDDTLYFKSDEGSRAEFEARGLVPFAFDKEGERVVTHYYAAPEEVFESPAEMARWARLGYAAALRAAAAKASKPRSPRKPPSARRRS